MFKFAALAVTPFIALATAEDAAASATEAYGKKPHPEPEYKHSDYGYNDQSYHGDGYEQKYDPSYRNEYRQPDYQQPGYQQAGYQPESKYEQKYEPQYNNEYRQPEYHSEPKYEPTYEEPGYDHYEPKYQPEYEDPKQYPEPKHYPEPKYEDPTHYPEPTYTSGYDDYYTAPQYNPTHYPEPTYTSGYDDYYTAPQYKEYDHEPFTPPEDPYEVKKDPKCHDKTLPNSAEFLATKCMEEVAPAAMEWINSRCNSANGYGHYATTHESYENSLCEYYSNKAYHSVMTACLSAATLRTEFVRKYAKEGKGVWKCKEDEFRAQTEKCYSKSAKYYPLGGNINYIEENFIDMAGTNYEYATDYKPMKLEGAFLAYCSFMNGDKVNGQDGYGYY